LSVVRRVGCLFVIRRGGCSFEIRRVVVRLRAGGGGVRGVRPP
jgi:hypothetical protein